MILFQNIRELFFQSGLVLFISVVVSLGFGSADSLATNLPTQLLRHPQIQIATINRAYAIQKNVEGKTQEAIGNITGDPKDQIMGKAKQVESQARNSLEDLKENMQLKGREKAVAKNIEGKFEEVKGKATGNRKEQFSGKAKQVESQARNTVEDAKDKVRDIFN